MNISYSSDEYDDYDDYEQYIGNSSKCKQHINNLSVAKTKNQKKSLEVKTKPLLKTHKPKQSNNKQTHSIIKEKKLIESKIESNTPQKETVIDDWEDLL